MRGVYSFAKSPDGNSLYVTSIVSDAIAIFDRNPKTGVLKQKPGAAGCISEDGTGGACRDGTALRRPTAVTLSSDGRLVYIGSFGSDAIAIFDRNAKTGALTQKPGTAGCISEDGTGGACRDGTALISPIGLATSPDGGSVYVASTSSDALVTLDRAAGPKGR